MAHFLAPLVKAPATAYALVNDRLTSTLAADVHAAFDSASRRRGLLGRYTLPAGVALIIAPRSAIHTWFMRFPIDVIFVRRDGTVQKACVGVRPWRFAVAFNAFAAIELASGAIERNGTLVGDRLRLEVRADSAPGQTVV